jgi:hypothetical protein
LSWREDSDSSKRIEHQQVRVTRDDVRRLTADRKRQELVVLRIATRHHILIRNDPLRPARQFCKKIADVLFIGVTSQFLANENVAELHQRIFRQKNGSSQSRVLERLPWDRTRQQKCAHEDVGIEDAPQRLAVFQNRFENLRRQPTRLRLAPGFFHDLVERTPLSQQNLLQP